MLDAQRTGELVDCAYGASETTVSVTKRPHWTLANIANTLRNCKIGGRLPSALLLLVVAVHTTPRLPESQAKQH